MMRMYGVLVSLYLRRALVTARMRSILTPSDICIYSKYRLPLFDTSRSVTYGTLRLLKQTP